MYVEYLTAIASVDHYQLCSACTLTIREKWSPNMESTVTPRGRNAEGCSIITVDRDRPFLTEL